MTQSYGETFTIDHIFTTNFKNLNENYKIEKSIGEGTFGKVKIAYHIKTNEKVAVKILEKSKIKDYRSLKRVKREISYLKSLNHINIIQLYEIIESISCIYLIMEYPKKGEFFDYIVKKKRLNELEASMFFYQIINGVEYIHQNNISHRDLKPENLLLDENKLLKIIDFGLSNNFNESNGLLVTPCGSPCYAAPEMLDGNKYNGITIDVWSTGIILYAMVCGYLPFEDPDNSALFKKIQKCKYDIPSNVSKTPADMIRKILVPDPNKRITIKEIKLHSLYLQGEKICKNDVNMINNHNEERLNQVVIEKLKELGFKTDNIKTLLKNHEFNETTASYKIMYKKLKNDNFLKSQNSFSLRTLTERNGSLSTKNSLNYDFKLNKPASRGKSKVIINNSNHAHTIEEDNRKMSELKGSHIVYTEPSHSKEKSTALDFKFTDQINNYKTKTFLYNQYSNSKPTKLKYYLQDLSSSLRKDLITPTNRDNPSIVKSPLSIEFNKINSLKKETNFNFYKKRNFVHSIHNNSALSRKDTVSKDKSSIVKNNYISNSELGSKLLFTSNNHSKENSKIDIQSISSPKSKTQGMSQNNPKINQKMVLFKEKFGSKVKLNIDKTKIQKYDKLFSLKNLQKKEVMINTMVLQSKTSIGK